MHLVSDQMWAGVSPVCPGADEAGVSLVRLQMRAGVGPVPVQMWYGKAQSRRTSDREAAAPQELARSPGPCAAPAPSEPGQRTGADMGGGEPSHGVDVGGVSTDPVRMRRLEPSPGVDVWAG